MAGNCYDGSFATGMYRGCCDTLPVAHTAMNISLHENILKTTGNPIGREPFSVTFMEILTNAASESRI
jgi:hypothetical protein